MDTKRSARKLGVLSQGNVSPDGITVEQLVGHGRYPHRNFLGLLTDEDARAIDRRSHWPESITCVTVRLEVLAAARNS